MDTVEPALLGPKRGVLDSVQGAHIYGIDILLTMMVWLVTYFHTYLRSYACCEMVDCHWYFPWFAVEIGIVANCPDLVGTLMIIMAPILSPARQQWLSRQKRVFLLFANSAIIPMFAYSAHIMWSAAPELHPPLRVQCVHFSVELILAFSSPGVVFSYLFQSSLLTFSSLACYIAKHGWA